MWDGPFLGKRDRGFISGHLLDFCHWERDEQLSPAQHPDLGDPAHSWLRLLPAPPPPRVARSDVSCRCCVLTVPDRAQARLWGWLAHQAQAAARACQCLPFLEAHTGSFRLAHRGHGSCLEGARLCASAMRAAEEREGKAWLGDPLGRASRAQTTLEVATCL